MDTNPVPDPVKPKLWQNSKLRVAVLLLILLSLLAFYFWKKSQLKSSVTENNQSNFDRYLDTLVAKLKNNQEPVATTAPIPSPSPTPTPTPKPLPHGPQTYTFSHGSAVRGPKPIKATVNPIDPKPNSYQTLTATIKHDKPVTTAKIILVTDNRTQPIPLKLTTGTTTNGTWTAKYQITDSYNQRYQILFELSDGQDTFDGGLTFR